ERLAYIPFQLVDRLAYCRLGAMQLLPCPGKLSPPHPRQNHLELSQVHLLRLKPTAITINISYLVSKPNTNLIIIRFAMSHIPRSIRLVPVRRVWAWNEHGSRYSTPRFAMASNLRDAA